MAGGTLDTRNIKLIAGTVALLTLTVGGYYLHRTTTNHDRLVRRNQRELDRITSTIELRVNNFRSVLKSLTMGASSPAFVAQKAELIPSASLLCYGSKNPCPEEVSADTSSTTSLFVGSEQIDFYYRHPPQEDGEAYTLGVSWKLSELEKSIRSDFFEHIVVAHQKTHVFLPKTPRGGIRVHELPTPKTDNPGLFGTTKPDQKRRKGGLPERVSAVQEVRIAGRLYYLFLQPVRIDIQERERTDGKLGPREASEWVVGGLVSQAKLKQESLALSPPHVLFLSLLLLFALLSVPLLRVALMSRQERLESSDVYLLGLALCLGAGIAGISLADLLHVRSVHSTFERQLEAVSHKIYSNFISEIEDAAQELDRRSNHFRCLLDWGKPQRQTVNQNKRTTRREDCLLWYSDTPPALPKKAERAEVPSSDNWFIRNELFRQERAPGYWRFSLIYWVDPCGNQAAKWTWKSQPTNLISVATRDYFRRIRNGTSWRQSSTKALPPAFYLQSIQSLTTGEYEAALSVPFEWDVATQDDGDGELCGADSGLGIAAMTIGPYSLNQPVMPPGFTFVIIDEGGQTLFHSRQERNLQEDFFEETESKLLRSVVAARSKGALDAHYTGRAHRFYVRPIADTPLTLIVAMRHDLLGNSRFEALFESALLFVLYALALLVVLALMESMLPSRFAWLWPSARWPQDRSPHTTIIVIFAALILIHTLALKAFVSGLLVAFMGLGLGFVGWIRSASDAEKALHSSTRRALAESFGWAVFAVAAGLVIWSHAVEPDRPLLLGLQAAAVMLSIVAVWTASRGREETSAHDGRQIPFYNDLVVLFLVAGFAAGPGYGMWRWAFEEHLQALAQHHQHEVARALWARRLRLRDEWNQRRFPADVALEDDELDIAYAPFLETVQTHPFTGDGVPGAAPSATEIVRKTDDGPGPAAEELDGHSSFHAVLRSFVPFVTDIAEATRGYTYPRDDGEGGWQREDSRISYRYRGLRLTSDIPSGIELSLEALAGLVFTLFLFGWLSRWVSRYAFLRELEHPGPMGLSESWSLYCSRPGARVLFIGEGTAAQDVAGMIDLVTTSTEDVVKRVSEDKQGDVLIKNLDCRFQDPADNDTLLELLEPIVLTQTRRVIVSTTREPWALLTPREGDEAEAGVAPEAPARWARVFGRFSKVYLAEKVSSEAAQAIAKLNASSEHRRVLRNEASELQPLCDIVLRVADDEKLAQLSTDALIDHVGEMADGYYRAIWPTLRPEEQVAAIQLATGAMANPKNKGAIRRLMARGLVIRSPKIRLMNESFARFVRGHATTPPDGASGPPAPSGWRQARVPVYLVLLTVAGFMLWTQQEFLSVATAFVSSLGIAIGGILKAFAHIQQPSSGSSPSG